MDHYRGDEVSQLPSGGDGIGLCQKDVASVLHPVTSYAVYAATGPKITKRAKGVYFWDDDNKQFLDGVAGLWCTAIGYGEPELAATAKQQLETLSYSPLFFGRSHETAILLAEKIKTMMPFDAGRVFFGLSGSDANDSQIKLIRYYNNAIGRPEKKKIISRQGSYHGLTMASAALSGLPLFHASFDLPEAGFLKVSSPHYYRGSLPNESELEFASRLVNEVEQLILSEGPETVAAFVAEPITGAGGLIVPPPGYYEQLQVVLDKHDVAFIDDEVICGFGRTGNLFGCQTMNFTPTTMTLAKGLSSGYAPLSAVVIPDFMAEAIIQESKEIGALAHGFTYSGHPLCTAIALKNLELLEERGVYDHAAKVAVTFQERLSTLRDHPLVGEAVGKGLLGAIELVQNKKDKASFPADKAVGAYCTKRCEANQLLLRPLGDRVVMSPPLVISDDEVNELFDKLEKSLNETLDWIHSERLMPADPGVWQLS